MTSRRNLLTHRSRSAAASAAISGGASDGTSGSVSATYLSGIVQFAVACGVARAALLRSIGLAEQDLDEPDRRLPLELVPRLFHEASLASANRAFALHFGVGVPCTNLTLAAALAAGQPAQHSAGVSGQENRPRTLRDALDGLNRYASLGIDFGTQSPPQRFRFVEGADGVWLEDLRPGRAAGLEWPALTESVFARFATGIRQRGGESIVRALAVTHEAPTTEDHRRAYDLVFRVPVTFGASRNALCLDPTFLTQPLDPLPAPVHAVLARHADAQLQALPQRHTWRGRVEDLLQAAFTTEDRAAPACNVVDVCRSLAVSRHTLHRRLRSEGTTFAAIHDEVRRRVADTLLGTDGLTVAAVGMRVGFSEAAAFSRAYQRWTGTRPGVYRASL